MNGVKTAPVITSLGDACCGCAACAARCPRSSVTMEPDACGFPHPSVDATTCVGCGACDAVCPVLNVPERDGCASVLWASARESDLLVRSSSGGVFGLLARDVISRGGVVAGAAWAESCREVRHVLVGGEAGLDAVMRSKYVQSSVGREVYEGVRDALRDRRPALFSGTACQVAAMRSYLGELAGSDFFLGVEVMCHGVPSPALWKGWLGHVEHREGGAVCGVNFRSKETGWSSYSVAYECEAGECVPAHVSSTVFHDDWYMRAFLVNASLRSSCLSCPFKRRCGSDITLGDFWGVRRQHPSVPAECGVSAVICGTPRGVDAVPRVAFLMEFGESSLDRVVAGNPSLVRPSRPHTDRETFMAVLANGAPVDNMIARWDFEPTLMRRLVSKARGIVRRVLGKA